MILENTEFIFIKALKDDNYSGNTELLKEELVPFELAENQKMFLKLQGAVKGFGQAHASLEGVRSMLFESCASLQVHTRQTVSNVAPSIILAWPLRT